jgi:hypothetical protein
VKGATMRFCTNIEFIVEVDAKGRDALAKTYGAKLPEKGLITSQKGLEKK